MAHQVNLCCPLFASYNRSHMPWILHVQHTQTTRQAKLLPRSGSALRQSATRWTWQGTLYAFVVHTVAPSGDQSILLNTDLEAPSKGSLIWWHSVSGSLKAPLATMAPNAASRTSSSICQSWVLHTMSLLSSPTLLTNCSRGAKPQSAPQLAGHVSTTRDRAQTASSACYRVNGIPRHSLHPAIMALECGLRASNQSFASSDGAGGDAPHHDAAINAACHQL